MPRARAVNAARAAATSGQAVQPTGGRLQPGCHQAMRATWWVSASEALDLRADLLALRLARQAAGVGALGAAGQQGGAEGAGQSQKGPLLGLRTADTAGSLGLQRQQHGRAPLRPRTRPTHHLMHEYVGVDAAAVPPPLE